MNFNYNTFAQKLDGYSGMDVDDEHTNYGWVQWDKKSTDDFNKVVKYTYENSKGTFHYETWHQETSLMKQNAGMMVSAKIDFNRGTGDDHIILMAGFNHKADLIFAQASVQFHGHEDANIITSPITSGDIAQGLQDAIQEQILDSYGHVDDSTDGRHTLPYIAKVNLEAMDEATSI
ncbi:hypothetical protein [Arundinibacter roseus]|uniref:Uncharacterized protein n=1 Tax=Arundinibacter roseus TaxID=2070510 RepID=A0A4R4KBK6_9BACT|nr:hypothetical protein [Arundinibacter roseus]TDB64066.1 hypothetical protein EZE20_14075 [Arundinibacter roseus]